MLCLGWVGVEGWRRARHAYRHVWDGQQPCIDRTPFYLRPPPPLCIPSLMCSQTALSNKLTVVNMIRIYTISMKTIKIIRFKSFFNVENALTPRPHLIFKIGLISVVLFNLCIFMVGTQRQPVQFVKTQ